MSDDTLVTAAEVARLANVGRAAVSNWRRRHSDFPEPVVGSGGSPTFRLDEVREWLRRQGKQAGLRPEEALWRALDAGRGESDVVELVADVAAYLCTPGQVRLPKAVRAELEAVGDIDAGELIESLTTMLFERQQRQHLATPPELAELMVELAAPVEGTVFDPACGPGNVLAAAAALGAPSVVGQEVSEPLAGLARARLADSSTEIAAGDTLRADAFPALRADAVVCDPPFGYRDWGHDDLGVDPRWEYGFPAKSEPELAWVQHCFAHARPGAPVVVAMPAGAAGRRSGRLIRQAMVRRGTLRAVIALPAGVLMSTGIAIHLWVLRKPYGDRIDPVLLLDAGHHRPHKRGQADWDAIGDDVLHAWRAFRDGKEVPELVGRRRVIEPIELLDEDVDFTPARHLPPPLRVVDLQALRGDEDELLRTLDDMRAAIPRVRESAPSPRAVTSVGELTKVGALELTMLVKPVETADDASGPPVLTGRDVVSGTLPGAYLAGGEHPVWLRPGDVVVPLISAGESGPAARVITEDGWALGPNLQLLRVDADRLDPWVLACHIRCGSHAVSTTTVSGTYRVDARRIGIPITDLDRQHEVGEMFRKLTCLETGLRQVSELGTRIARTLADGLADETVVPDE